MQTAAAAKRLLKDFKGIIVILEINKYFPKSFTPKGTTQFSKEKPPKPVQKWRNIHQMIFQKFKLDEDWKNLIQVPNWTTFAIQHFLLL